MKPQKVTTSSAVALLCKPRLLQCFAAFQRQGYTGSDKGQTDQHIDGKGKTCILDDKPDKANAKSTNCLLYTSDAADD